MRGRYLVDLHLYLLERNEELFNFLHKHNMYCSYNMPSKNGFVQVKMGTAGAAAVYGGEQPPIADAAGRVGWAFIKDGASPADAKCNWYSGPAANEVVSYRELSSYWSIITIDDFTDGGSLPWLQIYTKPKGDGSDASWYRSKLDLQIPLARELVRPGERVCLYWGKHHPPADQLDGARLIHLETVLTGPAILPDDKIYFLPLATDSAATSVGICVETIAYQLNSGAPHSRMINMHLVA